MGGEGYSLGDLAAVTRCNDNGGFGGDGGGWWALIVLFALFGGWGGGFGGFGGGRGEAVTEAGLCNAMNFNDLANSVGRMNDVVQANQRQTDNAICNLGYTQLAQFNQLGTQLAECCCTTQRAIDGVNYNAAMNASAIMQNDTANTQKILDKLCENEARAMQNRINQLELNQALQGVVRYPQGFTYTAGNSPFCGCNSGCCCGNGSY